MSDLFKREDLGKLQPQIRDNKPMKRMISPAVLGKELCCVWARNRFTPKTVSK